MNTPLNIAGGNLNVSEKRSPREQMLSKARRLKAALENPCSDYNRRMMERDLAQHMEAYRIRENEL